MFGHTVRSSNGADPAKHTGHINYTPPGFLNEGKNAQGHSDNSIQVNSQHGLVVCQGQPVTGSRGDGDPRIIDHSPQTWQTWKGFSAFVKVFSR